MGFDKKDCFHLMGLQYLIDRPELSRDRGKVFDEIADGTITIKKIESSAILNKLFLAKVNLSFFFKAISDKKMRFPFKKAIFFEQKGPSKYTHCSLLHSFVQDTNVTNKPVDNFSKYFL